MKKLPTIPPRIPDQGEAAETANPEQVHTGDPGNQEEANDPLPIEVDGYEAIRLGIEIAAMMSEGLARDQMISSVAKLWACLFMPIAYTTQEVQE